MATKGETTYQRKLIEKMNDRFPGCFIVKNDPSENQGVPDLLILFKKTWAMLEVKVSAKAKRQPNQDYYVEKFGKMSFAAVIHPGNEEKVLSDLQSALGTTRKARLPKS